MAAFHEVRFPLRLALGVSGGPVYASENLLTIFRSRALESGVLRRNFFEPQRARRREGMFALRLLDP